MARVISRQGDLVNGDSFVDIVASVVAIMLIMVVLEGSRIKNAPPKISLPPVPEESELKQDLAAEQALREEILQMADEIRSLQQEATARCIQRDLLVTTVSAVEQKIAQHREQLGREQQIKFDAQRRLAEARFQLEQLERQKQLEENRASRPIVVESYPTPISRVVDGPEAHLLISNGRVVFIPLEPLLERFKAEAKAQAHKLLNQQEFTDTVGPIEGFRLQYTLERFDVPPEMYKETGRGGSFARLQKWVLLPLRNDLGEPVRLALQEDSDFRRQLSKILPGRTTITIWVYPDGFDAFRQVRKELYRLGYAVAARPLPPGVPITGSPEGSKSAAQ